MPTNDERSGIFDGCETLVELLVALRHLLGGAGVEQFLQQEAPKETRQSLRNAADELKRVGLRHFGATVRRHARRAPLAPPTFAGRVAARKGC